MNDSVDAVVRSMRLSDHMTRDYISLRGSLHRVYSYEKGTDTELHISHELSHNNNYLQCVDFFCWAIHRKYNKNDDSYYCIFSDCINMRQKWYADTKKTST